MMRIIDSIKISQSRPTPQTEILCTRVDSPGGTNRLRCPRHLPFDEGRHGSMNRPSY